MAGLGSALEAHLKSGSTTLCHCWAVTRRDGVEFGFTDHDCDLLFDGLTFKAGSGLSALALQQSTGLSVDNSEAMGALSDAALRDADIEAGRFDQAEVRAWMVNWADPGMRWLQFRGCFGEIRRAEGAFNVELRGLTEQLNTPQGRVCQKPCSAVLGDGDCRFNLDTPGYHAEVAAGDVAENRLFQWQELPGFAPGWFAHGRMSVLSGAAAGLWGLVKFDRVLNGLRVVELWQPLAARLAEGDLIRLDAGCDKRPETCRFKFNNFLNYQGFPDIPGEDWVMSVPRQGPANSGGSRR